MRINGSRKKKEKDGQRYYVRMISNEYVNDEINLWCVREGNVSLILSVCHVMKQMRSIQISSLEQQRCQRSHAKCGDFVAVSRTKRVLSGGGGVA